MSEIKDTEVCKHPEVTIVTVVRNHPLGLVATIESLFKQTYNNWKLIIIVGESNDNTLEIAQSYSNASKKALAVEQDGIGIYQAMNQATKMVTSKYVWYMNAGDQFYDELSLASAIAQAEENCLDLLIGGHKVDNGQVDAIYSYPERTLTPFWFSVNRRFGCHQAMLFLTSKIKSLGYYDTNYKIAADFELVMRLCSMGAVRRTPSMLAIVEPGGGADQNIVFVHREKQVVRENLLESRFLVLMGQIWTEIAILNTKFKKFKRYPRTVITK